MRCLGTGSTLAFATTAPSSPLNLRPRWNRAGWQDEAVLQRLGLEAYREPLEAVQELDLVREQSECVRHAA